MVTGSDDFEDFDLQVDSMEDALAGASATMGRFEDELTSIRENAARAGESVGSLSSSIGRDLREAFEGLVFDGKDLTDVLASAGQSISRSAFSTAVKPVTSQLSGLVSGGLVDAAALAFEKGASFSQGRVTAFQKGGVVSSPTTFPMRGATGLMGEAGPEAIMPLARNADGSLGVRAEGSASQPVNIVMNISTPDVTGFERSQSQIATRVARALGRGNRNR